MSFLSKNNVLEFIPNVRDAEIKVTEPVARRPDLLKPKQPIIAICHLSWDWVWQRPQQFLSRLAKNHPVLFVETHCTQTSQSYTITRGAINHPAVTILEIHLPAERWHDGDFIDAERRRVLQRCLSLEFAGAYNDAILWFNDPMAVIAYAGHLGESIIVYDCMDELTQFNGASPLLRQREYELTLRADLIFCGGRKMRDKRLPYNSNTHFYGTGVDCGHFGRVLSDELEVDPEIAALPGPVLGYFGVVDERIDYDLLAALADAHSDWSIAMVGPIAKVDPATLPRRHNLHWLGGRPYERLPAITKGFSVCLMPFALNAATEFINPTKALEYMAAGRPVVSTALDEVRTNFSPISQVANTHAEFIAMCKREVDSPDQSRIRSGVSLAAENTWEAIAAKMESHIQDVLHPRRFSKAELPVKRQSGTKSQTEVRAAYV
ncbi:MAG: glycosyltransferase [Verrucomicrobiota bacterium]